jgi:uncharacterized protein YceK
LYNLNVTSSPTQSEIMSYPRLLSLITCLCLTSCGTLISLIDDPGGYLGVDKYSRTSVYRGTQWDLNFLNEGGAYPSHFFPLLLVDIPLCIAADTLLLPYDVYATIRERNEELAKIRATLSMNVVGFDGKPAKGVCLWLGTEKTDIFFSCSSIYGRASKSIRPGRYRVLITPRHKYEGGVNKREDREATDDERMTIMTIEIKGYEKREIEVRLPKESGY